MIRIQHLLTAGMLTVGLLLSTGFLAGAENPATKDKSQSPSVAQPPSAVPADSAQPGDKKRQDAASTAPKPKRELSAELAALRDRVRQVLAMHQKLPFNTQQNTPTEIMGVCLAFGCNSEVSLEGADGQRINAIGCLCYNYPCSGLELLTVAEKHVVAKIGYGYQERPGEFLATLALSGVPVDYGVRVGKTVRKVADLAAAEKLACRTGGEHSLRLVGLSYYVDEPEWKNDLGETWSIERMIKEEIAEPVVTAPEGGLNRLMGLSYAVARRLKRGQPLAGQFERAAKYTADYQAFAMQMQSADGSWGPYFLAARSTSQEPESQLRTTGRVLEWLAMSLPDKRLEDARVVAAVDYVTSLLGAQRYQWNAPSLSTREIVSMGHALHALATYDERVFRPADVEEKPAPEKPPAEKPSPATASWDGKATKSR
jgi:hypothetical protein